MKLTENMKNWLKQSAKEHYGIARNNHIWAMGSNTTKEATEFELLADEHRAFARILEAMAKENEEG